MRKHTCTRLGFIVVSDFVVYLHISRSCNAVFVVCCLWLFHLVVSCCRSFYSLFMSLLRREEEKKKQTHQQQSYWKHWLCTESADIIYTSRPKTLGLTAFLRRTKKTKHRQKRISGKSTSVILMFYQLFSTRVFGASTQFSGVLFYYFVTFGVHLIKRIEVKYSAIW